MIDLRSDTVTRPSEGMRQAMAEASVGDDVYGEDPTVNRLQERMADLLGTEAALFVPSGTMANQISLHVLTDPGDEVIVARSSHIFNYETGAAGLLSGVQLHPVDGVDGRLTPDAVTAAIRPEGDVFPPTRVVSLENTSNKAGGTLYSLHDIHAIADVVRDHGVHFQLDGARLWNAATALGVPEYDLTAPFDLVWVALSKGLGCPVGSMLAGPQHWIDAARVARKRFGGGMRQAGILAAAGLYALEHHRPHLHEDHQKARRLAEGLAELDAFAVDLDRVQTNIVLFDVMDGTAHDVVTAMQEAGVGLTPFGPHTVRATTHRDVSMDDVETALEAFRVQYASVC